MYVPFDLAMDNTARVISLFVVFVGRLIRLQHVSRSASVGLLQLSAQRYCNTREVEYKTLKDVSQAQERF